MGLYVALKKRSRIPSEENGTTVADRKEAKNKPKYPSEKKSIKKGSAIMPTLKGINSSVLFLDEFCSNCRTFRNHVNIVNTICESGSIEV